MSRLLTIVVAGMLVAVMSDARAAVITTPVQTLTFGPALTEFTPADAQSFQLFDTRLGTLQAVTFSASYGFTSTITVINSARTTSKGSVQTESAAWFGSSSTAIGDVLNAKVNTGFASISGVDQDFAAFDLLGSKPKFSALGQSTLTLPSNITPQTLPLVTDTDGIDLVAFETIGGGLASIDLETLTGTLLSTSSGNTNATQSTTAAATFSISYIYTRAVTPIPEPASTLLLGVGLLGAGLGARRRA